MTAPRVALLLLRLLLPRRWREVIAGDLEEEWHQSSRPSRLGFWSLAARSIVTCWIDQVRSRAERADGSQAPPQRGDSLMQSLLQDLRYGWRLLWKNPGFTIAAVATLALGIGANSAIFRLFNVLSLKALPYHEPSRVAFVLGWDVEEGEMLFNLRLADYVDLQGQVKSLEAIAAYSYLSANLTGGDLPERVQAYRVTPNTFALLGVPAALGRVFEAGAERVPDEEAVISHGLWQRRFGGDRSIVGRRMLLNGRPYEVVGVMPPRFEYPVFNFKGDLWIPWQPTDGARGQPAVTVLRAE